MKACIVQQCISGIGDQYTSLLSSWKIYKDLQALGYDVEVTWYMQNQYYPSDLPLDYLFDQSCFEGKVSYGKENEIKQQYILLPQKQNSIRIYVSEIIPELETYEAIIYGYAWYHATYSRKLDYSHMADTSKQFLSQEVLEIADNFRQGRTAIRGVHFRVQDICINHTYEELIANPDLAAAIGKVKNFIVDSTEQEVMLCSNNRHFVKALTSTYPNTFENSFTYDLPSYYSYSYKNAHTRPVSEFIRHAQETAAEMAMFKYCTKIQTYNTFHSSYLSYGVAHNIHHLDWRTKLSNLVYE